MGLHPARKNPHQGQPILLTGESLGDSKAAMLMLHGRGATAEDILSLSGEFDQPGFTYLAPQAAENTWYPNRFTAPIEANEPWLTSALEAVEYVFSQIVDAGIPPERILLLGFSQGACLTLEYAARNARRFGGIVGLSGGLIGPEDMQREYSGSLAGTPVFLGCSTGDFHIPRQRVDHAAEVLRALGGEVTKHLYPDLGHAINQDEIDFVRGMMKLLLSNA